MSTQDDKNFDSVIQHPLIQGMLATLPPVGNYWSKLDRNNWILMVEFIFNVIYTTTNNKTELTDTSNVYSVVGGNDSATIIFNDLNIIDAEHIKSMLIKHAFLKT